MRVMSRPTTSDRALSAGGAPPLASAALLAAAIAAMDQGSKYWALSAYNLRATLRVDDVAPFVNFVFARNTGVNFGLFASGSEHQQVILALLAAVVSAALFVWTYRSSRGAVAFGSGLVAGGALSNAYDRLTEGAVIDFLNVSCCGIENPYAFNVADAAIFLGAIYLAWRAWEEDAAPS